MKKSGFFSSCDQAIGGGRFIVFDKTLSSLSAELSFAVADNFQGFWGGNVYL